ncbi:hypothetical protein M413DRAFT_442266 [Hebeloma cylindrosporum]|uniref:Uncharacterized protein n=1 Tax=Hebeloma cylindrosporum TaxID=76867 RepID=A0A0C3CPC8_HEBCY|nr:hypothetical protein M413DRAFT_442266 [Hebeloma cylindrosporum h7]
MSFASRNYTASRHTFAVGIESTSYSFPYSKEFPSPQAAWRYVKACVSRCAFFR